MCTGRGSEGEQECERRLDRTTERPNDRTTERPIDLCVSSHTGTEQRAEYPAWHEQSLTLRAARYQQQHEQSNTGLRALDEELSGEAAKHEQRQEQYLEVSEGTVCMSLRDSA